MELSSTHTISRDKWKYYPELFDLGYVLNDLENELSNMQDQR